MIVLKWIGMLHHYEHPSNVKKAYPFAAVAKMEQIPFVYFSFGGIDFENGMVNGWVYEGGGWKGETVKIPNVIINSCNPKNQEQREVINKLKLQSVAFTSHPVGSKLKVYKKISNGEQFADYIIPSVQISHPDEIFPFLQEHPRAVFKPLSGNQGKQVYFIQHIEQLYKIIDGSSINTFSRKDIWLFINRHLKEKRYLLQPYIECKTKSGFSYDFRLHVQKNGSGEWEINLIYPRISGSGKLISNISSGGYRGELEPFLKEEFGESAIDVKEKLEEFALSFPAHFDTLYEYSFDELGIDLGVDENQKFWVFEVNWRPGCKHREFEVAKRLIPYCRYLTEKNT